MESNPQSTEERLFDENELRLCNKPQLLNIATNIGLLSSGFNGRVRSKMRKLDFIKFIVSRRASLRSHTPLGVVPSGVVPPGDLVSSLARITDSEVSLAVEVSCNELKSLPKSELRHLAYREGLTASGFNGRPRSRMRKVDLVEFIIISRNTSTTSATNNDYDSSSSTSNSTTSNYSTTLSSSTMSRSSTTRRQVRRELLSESGDDLFREIMENLLITSLIEGRSSTQPIQVYASDASFGRYTSRVHRSPFVFGEVRSAQASDARNIIDVFVNNLRSEPEESVSERVPHEEDEEVPNLDIREEISDEVKTNVKNLEIKTTCVICQINMRNIVFVPCNHFVACISCSKDPNLGDKCPLCRKEYTSTIRVFS